MDYEEELMDNSAAVRCLGVFLLFIGAWIGYGVVYTPIQQAYAGAETISLDTGYVGLSAVCLLCGIIFLVAGRHVKKFLMLNWHTTKPLQVIGTLVLAAIVIAAEICLKEYLEFLGYAAP